MTFGLKKIVAKLAIATVGAIFVATGVKSEPSQAASFTFILTNGSGNQGSLSFSNTSNLVGVGRETASLSDLPDASFSLNYSSILPLGVGGYRVSGFSFSNPTFDFNDGNLIGINGSSSVPFDVFDGRMFPRISEVKGFDQLTLAGATFTESLSGVATVFNAISGQILSTQNIGPLAFNRGQIVFTTIEPVSRASVPEPANAIGLVALGLLAFGQRKLSKRGLASGNCGKDSKIMPSPGLSS